MINPRRYGGALIGLTVAVTALIVGEFFLAGVLVAAVLWHVTDS